MSRKIKVEEEIRENTAAKYTGSRYTRSVVPKVRLCGKWLQAAGFMPGTHLELTVVSPGVIELRVCGQPKVDPECTVALERLDLAIARDEQRKRELGI